MNWKETIYRQYSTSKVIMGMIETFNDAVSIDDFTNEFIDKVWDVLTANSYGLDIWGKIVNIGRYQKVSIDDEFFGYSNGFYSFNEGTFKNGEQETENMRLGDAAYRTLILAKAFSNISIATIKDFNKFLSILFKDRGDIFCTNPKNMTMGITAMFELYPYEISILTNTDVIPIPSGVEIKVVEIINPLFGFSEDSYPFNDGVFFDGITYS